ncbi:MAG: helix-turn-helix domain-containing protein [Planctomycetia bacterium]|nr:helix-turn-helix domain-containing protein [Planctomycetia bacterium]
MDEQRSDIPPPELQLKPTQAAKLVGVHLATIYRWMDDGILPYWRKGRRQRFLYKPDVLAMVRPASVEQKQQPNQPPKVSAWERDLQAQRTQAVLKRFGMIS